MRRPKVSAALATYNEEANILDCLKSLNLFAEEIVVVDGESTDRTVEIAKANKAKVITTTNKPMFHINKNLAITNCKNPWIFLIDADERVSLELAQEIKTLLAQNPSENGFWINRRNWFLGGFLKKGGAYPDSVIRLFRNGKGKLPEESLHEQVKIEGEVGNLKHDLLHFADPNFNRYLLRANRYTSESARHIKDQKQERGVKGALNHLFLKPILTFFDIYFRHRGYVDGFRGFIWALFSSAHHFYAYVKYWEPKTQNESSS